MSTFAFAVPKGLEQISFQDIYENLDLTGDFTVFEDSGFVFFTPQNDLEWKYATLCVEKAQFLSVNEVYVTLGRRTIEKKMLGENFGALLEHFIQENTLAWDTCLEAWSELSCNVNKTYKSTQKFRATFDKNGHTHSLTSQKLASCIGSGILQIQPAWTVSLTQYDIEIFATLITRSSKSLTLSLPPQITFDIFFGITLSIPATQNLMFRNRIHLGRTSLRPTIAHCLLRLSNPQPGEIVLDPCCGVGTIPIEGCYWRPKSIWFGGEMVQETICEKGRKNAYFAGTDVDFIVWDGKRIGMRNGIVDIVVTDLPWGIREGSFRQIEKLYPRLLKELARCMRIGGRAFILTQGHKLMQRTLEYPWCSALFALENVTKITVGYETSLYYLIRK